jgi:hypothetical protein
MPYLNTEEVAIYLRFFRKERNERGEVVAQVPDLARAWAYVTRMQLPTKHAGRWVLVSDRDLEKSLTGESPARSFSRHTRRFA